MPYQLNGQSVSIGQDPVVKNGRNFVPLEEVVKGLGGTVSWDHGSKTATATIGQWAAKVQADNTNVDVSGTPVTLSEAPYIEDGTMYVPWTFFKEAYGYKSEMQDGTLSVYL